MKVLKSISSDNFNVYEKLEGQSNKNVILASVAIALVALIFSFISLCLSRKNNRKLNERLPSLNNINKDKTEDFLIKRRTEKAMYLYKLTSPRLFGV